MIKIQATASFDQRKGVVQIEIPIECDANDPEQIILTIQRKYGSDNSTTWEKKYKRTNPNAASKATLLFYDISAPLGEVFKYQISIKTGNNIIQAIDKEQCIISEDIFLQDTDSLFKIKFNPDIANYKRVLGDSYTQTLGAKYPFFRRNGDMSYLQFNIGGLISYHMNDEYAFPNAPSFNNEIEREFYQERLFRDRVLNFFYSDKEKLLRSTTEGNKIVRLTNISLTPNKQLGRMIYSFSAQATEVKDASMENYKVYGQQTDFVDFDIEIPIDGNLEMQDNEN